MTVSAHDQLVHFLSDMYSVEQQALAQLVSAPDMAGDPTLSAMFREHHVETKQQAALVEERLRAHDGSPSAIKDAVMKLGGKGFLLFARIMPETPGRLVVHSYAYEAMEWAGYEMLLRFANRAGDAQTEEAARMIGAQERAMMERLERGFDAAEQASHGETPLSEMNDEIRKHLTEAHALASQGLQLLKKSEDIAGNAELTQIYADHRAQTEVQARRIEERLKALNADTSAIEDFALRFGGVNWGLFFQAQTDTPAKLAAFVYAFEHLEIAAYELLRRSANRAVDSETQRLCEAALSELHPMVDRLMTAFDSAVDATLGAGQPAGAH